MSLTQPHYLPVAWRAPTSADPPRPPEVEDRTFDDLVAQSLFDFYDATASTATIRNFQYALDEPAGGWFLGTSSHEQKSIWRFLTFWLDQVAHKPEQQSVEALGYIVPWSAERIKVRVRDMGAGKFLVAD
jgi:hypothetical protein